MGKKAGLIFLLMIVLTLSMVCGGCGDGSAGRNEVEIVTVSGEAITLRQIRENMILTAFANGRILDDYDAAEREEFESATLESMITNVVMRHYLESAETVPTSSGKPDDVDRYAENLKADVLVKELLESGELSESSVENFAYSSWYAELFYDEMKKSVDLSDEVLREYSDTHKENLMRSIVKASHILVTDLEEAEDIRERLIKGEDFATLAATYSVDIATKDAGGDLGEFGKNETMPEFEEAVFSMEKGEISEPVKTTVGFHIIRLDDKYEQELDFDIQKPYIEDVLIKEACNEKIRQLRQVATITYSEK